MTVKQTFKIFEKIYDSCDFCWVLWTFSMILADFSLPGQIRFMKTDPDGRNETDPKHCTCSYLLYLKPVLRIRIRFNETDPDPGSKNSAKIMENFHKNQPKSLEYHTFLNSGTLFLWLPCNIVSNWVIIFRRK